jgi:hypothetical protein
MTQEPVQLKAHIREQSEGLRSNIEEIESRVKEALDWRTVYGKNTALALGGGVAVGLILSFVIPKKRSSATAPYEPIQSRAEAVSGTLGVSHAQARVRQVFDNTLSAVVGLAAEKFQDFMSDAFPGFLQHYSQAERTRSE